MSWSEKNRPRSRPRVPCPVLRAPPRRQHLQAPGRAAGWPQAQDCVSCRLGSQPGDAALPRAPATPVTPQRANSGAREDLGAPDTAKAGGGVGGGCTQQRVALLHSRSCPPRRKCAPKLPASAPQELDGPGRKGGPTAPGEADPAKPQGAGASCCRRCQGPIQVQGTEGEASGNQAPAGALRARAAGAAPT